VEWRAGKEEEPLEFAGIVVEVEREPASYEKK
jgi:hypothetical protein